MAKKLKNDISINDAISQYYKVRKYAAEKSLHEFLKQAWIHIEGDMPFIDNWHLEAIAKYLEACYYRRIKRLLICVPPRSSKTTLISICFPAWVWIQNPQEKFLYFSYAQALSLEHSLKCRRLIESDWFQRNWGDKFKLASDQNTKGKFENNKKGYRIASSVGGVSTGFGGSFLIIDDGNNARDCESETKRESTNTWLNQVWSSRLNNAKEDVKIIVQQRVHENDIAGNIITNDINNEWIKLILPMEFELSRKTKHVFGDEVFWQDPRTIEGELLFPERFASKEVERFKRELGSYAYAGQHQQRPAPLEGGILKKAWFKIYNKNNLPIYSLILQSWDTAFSDKPNAAYSACTTWAVFEENGVNNILLLSCWRGQVDFTELRKRAIRLFNNFADIGDVPKTTRSSRVNKCIVEAKASGDPLISNLRESGIEPIRYNPKGDKRTRIQIVSPYIEAGIVHILDAKENMIFLDEMAKFPNGGSNDYADTLSQVLGFLRDNSMLTIPYDPKPKVYKSDFEIPYPSYKWR